MAIITTMTTVMITLMGTTTATRTIPIRMPTTRWARAR